MGRCQTSQEKTEKEEKDQRASLRNSSDADNQKRTKSKGKKKYCDGKSKVPAREKKSLKIAPAQIREKKKNGGNIEKIRVLKRKMQRWQRKFGPAAYCTQSRKAGSLGFLGTSGGENGAVNLMILLLLCLR